MKITGFVYQIKCKTNEKPYISNMKRSKYLHGNENFEISIETIDGRSQPCEREKYWISKLKTNINFERRRAYSNNYRSVNETNSNISEVCRGKKKTAGGFVWQYEQKG